MSKEGNLLGSFGKPMELDAIGSPLQGKELNNANEHSFFKNLPEVIVEPTNSFDLDEKVLDNKQTTDIPFNYHQDNLHFNANNDILFSGYFGQKTDEEIINGNKKVNELHRKTKPFPTILEERANKKSYSSLNSFNNKKQRLDKSLNHSYISTTSRNSFSDMVKSVSITTSKKKSNFFNSKKFYPLLI